MAALTAEQLEATAADLLRRAGEARAVAGQSDCDLLDLEACVAMQETELVECCKRLESLKSAEEGVRLRLEAILEAAAGEVKGLSKQQLEEVRSLQTPSPILRRALGLVYFVLHPDRAMGMKDLDEVPWKQKLAPMLKRDDLVRRILDYPPPLVSHPLLAHPSVLELIERNVSEVEGAKVSNGGRRSSKFGRRGSKDRKNSASSVSAQSLIRSPSLPLREVQFSPTNSQGLVHCMGPVDEPGPLQRSLTSGSTASTLLSVDGRLTVEAVDYASIAVGALFRWVLSQLRYARTVRDAKVDNVEDQADNVRADMELLKVRQVELQDALAILGTQVQALRESARAANEHAEQLESSAAQAAAEAALVVERLQHETTAAAAAAQSRQSLSPIDEPLPSETTRESDLEEALESGEVAVSSVDVVVRERITFAQGSVQMSSIATRAVQGVVNIMRGTADVKICVEGHCSAHEADSLGTRRANAVLEHLVTQGVPRHRLRAAGFGSAFPEGHRSGSSSSSSRVEFSVIQEISINGVVQFSPCSDQLTSSSKPLLDRVAALLIARPCLHVRIEGHTDNAPNWGCSNQELSEGRARNVVEYLASQGVVADQLVAVGCGEALPRAANRSREDRARNRRVEFHVLQQETIQGLKELRVRDGVGAAALLQLARTATGTCVKLPLPIRLAAADLLMRFHADWPVQRLFLVAALRGDPIVCPAARLPIDCVHRVLRLYFLLGCSTLGEGRGCTRTVER